MTPVQRLNVATPLTLLVIAKAPVAGHVKTRLCPPCTPNEAAFLAEGAIIDTLKTVRSTPADRYALALDGVSGAWLPDGFEVLPQHGRGLDERLANAFRDVFMSSPAPCRVVLVGMDTPQISSADLTAAADALCRSDAALGLADDGGWWCIGLKQCNDDVFLGVPMSESTTGVAQQRRLDALGLQTAPLRVHLDVDTFADAISVAAIAPEGEFARRTSFVDARVTREANEHTEAR